ncbi:MAG TPA: sugar-binding protein [Tepidisphaeraceae bacterium]|jgi:hypothetical protein|nr:sugar-binding protein [Tepidisphaeraceae bacterium]
MKGIQSPVESLPTPELPERVGWRRYFTRQRLRLFIVVSIAAHLVLGMSWGVPAYVKQKHLEAERRRQEAMLQEQRAAAQAASARAKAQALAQTIQDVADQTHKAFDAIAADLRQTDKVKTWTAVAPKLQPAELQLATALGDRSMTDQDLRNLQADLDRQLVNAVNDTLTVDIGKDETEAFLAAVQTRIVPELVNHYKTELHPKVVAPVRAAADAFVKSTRDDAAEAIAVGDADRQAVSVALRKMGEELDAAAGETDQVQALTARKTPAPAEEIQKHSQSANMHLTTAAAAAESSAQAVARLREQFKSLNGASELNERLEIADDSVSESRKAIKAVSLAIGAGNDAGTGAKFTALVLAQRKLAAQWTSAAEAAGRVSALAEQSARGALDAVKDDSIPRQIDQRLAEAFEQKASRRLTDVLAAALRKRLTAAGVKPDEAMIVSTTKQVKSILDTKVGAAGGYGASTSQTLRYLAGAAERRAGAEGKRLAEKFTQTAGPVIVEGVDQVIADDTFDTHLAEMVSRPEQDPGRDDVRDRVAMLAARASDGRANALDTVSITDLRSSAMARAANSDHSAAADAGGPTTEPADAPPVIEEIKQEILAGLKAELQKVFDGKLPEEKAAKVWKDVAKASDGDVNHLAQDLINPNVSDSDLESRRLEFSGKFLNSVRGALDKTGADQVAKDLVKQLEGKAGDAVAGAYKNAVKENVGAALAREWRGAADANRAAASQQVRDIRVALDSARSVADKAAQILDQVKDQTARAVQNARGDTAVERQTLDAGGGKLKEIASAIDGAKADMQKAQKDLPEHAAELKRRLGEIDTAFDDVAASISEAEKTAKADQAPEFGKAVTAARKQVDQFRAALQGGANDLSRDADQAEAKFAKAAEKSRDDSAAGAPGVQSRIERKFAGAFRKDALPRLTNQIVKGYQRKLEQAGVATDADGTAALERAIAAALDKKVTGEARVGEAAIGEVERQRFFDAGKNVKEEPRKELVDRANAIADKVTNAGVATTVQGDAADGAALGAVNAIAKLDPAIGDLKDKVARMQGQLRGGRGGVLADAADGADAPGDAVGIGKMRRKWRGLLAGLDGNADADGAGKAGGKPGAAGVGESSAAGAGSGAGSGSGGGHGLHIGRGIPGGNVLLDSEKYKSLVAALKDRAIQQGDAWDRKDADGQATRREGDAGASHPASIVAPTTQPAQSAKNDQPFAPGFKSLQFAVAPYLNTPIAIGDNFDAWKDIPAIHLRPERAWLTDTTGLKIVDDLPVKIAWDNHGLYFMLDMIDPDGRIEKAHVSNFWMCDAMEVFLDTLNTKESRRGTGAGQQFWAWPFGSADDADAPGGESLYDRHSGFHFVGLKPDELQRYARTTANGYQLQWHVPTERVRDADLVPGKILGFNITVETGVKMHYYWSASKVVVTSVHPDTWGDVLLGGSDGRVEFPAKLFAEAGPALSKKTVNAFVVGEPLRIRVTDRDMNLNDKVKDKVSVTVRNARGEQEVAILEETGADTGVFEGSIRTAFDIGERIPGALGVYEGESLIVTYIDQARANGARNTEIISKIKAGPTVTVGQAK